MNPAYLPGPEFGDPVSEDGPVLVAGARTTVWAVPHPVAVDGRMFPRSIVLMAEPEDSPVVIVHASMEGGEPRITTISEHGDIRRKHREQVRLSAVAEAFALLSQEKDVVAVLESGLEVFRTVRSDPTAAQEAVEAVRRQRSLTPSFLAEVAELYRANFDRAPTKAIRRKYVISERTASNWVQACRRSGLLPPTTTGKKRA